MRNKIFLLPLTFLFIFVACENTDYTPKPKAYPRIEFPTKLAYVPLESSDCPYTFNYPTHATLVRDTFYFDEEILSNCWYNIIYPTLNGTLHISYKEIGKDITLEKVKEDTHELTYTHSKKADYIDEFVINNKNGVQGLMFEVGGNAATNLQFYLSDDTKHYLRGALYFKATPNADSIAPVVEYVKDDLLRLFESVEWKE